MTSENDPVPAAASSALEELLEVSPQVEAAVILERDGGSVLASAPNANTRMAERFGTVCQSILAAAERARTELGREPISQIEVATPDGHVFIVADTGSIVAAVTDADPTVGLVFYDLKTALRSVRETRADGDRSSNGGNGAATKADRAGDDESSADGDETQAAGRWRRGKS